MQFNFRRSRCRLEVPSSDQTTFQAVLHGANTSSKMSHFGVQMHQEDEFQDPCGARGWGVGLDRHSPVFTFLKVVFIFFLLGFLRVKCYQEEAGNVLLLILHIRNEEYFMLMHKLLLFDVLITDRLFLFLFVTHEIAPNGTRSTMHNVLE